jgi:hypothetical protein
MAFFCDSFSVIYKIVIANFVVEGFNIHQFGYYTNENSSIGPFLDRQHHQQSLAVSLAIVDAVEMNEPRNLFLAIGS